MKFLESVFKLIGVREGKFFFAERADSRLRTSRVQPRFYREFLQRLQNRISLADNRTGYRFAVEYKVYSGLLRIRPIKKLQPIHPLRTAFGPSGLRFSTIAGENAKLGIRKRFLTVQLSSEYSSARRFGLRHFLFSPSSCSSQNHLSEKRNASFDFSVEMPRRSGDMCSRLMLCSLCTELESWTCNWGNTDFVRPNLR